MLKYSITDAPVGSLGLNGDAISWLTNSYIPEKLQVGISRIVAFERAMRGVAYNPDWYKDAVMPAFDGSLIDLTVDVVLHPDAWIDPFGRSVWGLFWNPATAWSRPKVEVAWRQDYGLGYGVMTHELVHMLEYYDINGPTWWSDWQHSLHGKFSLNSKGELQDQFLIACNSKVQEGFPLPLNHSYHPGQLPCGGSVNATSYAMSFDGSFGIHQINLFSDGRLEVWDSNGRHIRSLETSVAECALEVVKNIESTTLLYFIHAESGASAELTKNQFMDRLLMFM